MTNQLFEAGSASCASMIAAGIAVEIDHPLVPYPSCGSWLAGWNAKAREHQSTEGEGKP